MRVPRGRGGEGASGCGGIYKEAKSRQQAFTYFRRSGTCQHLLMIPMFMLKQF
jgi:hypothetical protein